MFFRVRESSATVLLLGHRLAGGFVGEVMVIEGDPGLCYTAGAVMS